MGFFPGFATQHHHLQDRISLEMGSCLKMNEWLSLLEELTAPHTQPHSLRAYMTAEERARFFQGDVPDAVMEEESVDLASTAASASATDLHTVRRKRTC